MELGRLDEARQVLEECLRVFREVDDLTMQSNTLSALSNIWKERGDIEQAISLQRQALNVCNRLPDPGDRGISHLNLCNYLDKSGKIEEGAANHLAAGIYYLISGRHAHNWMGNLKIRIRRAAKSNQTYELPRIADLLSRPEFQALDQFLTQYGVDRDQLQGEIDRLVGQARGG